MLVYFFQDLEGLTEVFGRMSAGTSGRKLPLGADFCFLLKGDKPSERKLSNGRSRSYSEIKLLLSARNARLRIYGEINQHPHIFHGAS